MIGVRGNSALLVSLDPTPHASAIIDGLDSTRRTTPRHIALRAADALPDALTGTSQSSPHASSVLVLVNIDELDLADLELIHSAVDDRCQIISLYREDLTSERYEWVMRSGGVALRSTNVTSDDVASLEVLVYGPSIRPEASAKDLTIAPEGPVFLCHSSQDDEIARQLHSKLTGQEGLECWLDKMDLVPGQDWGSAIRQALSASSRVLVLLTDASTRKRGFLQAELRLALEEAERQPPDEIFLIPVRLEPCALPESLEHLHYVDLFEQDGFERLIRAIRFKRP